MERYDYYAAIKEDVKECIFETYSKEEITSHLENKDEFIEKLHDDLWVCDSVTGNASGSYTFNAWKAEENLCHNLDLLKDALDEFCCDYSKALENGAEYCDVTIRCYLLGSVIYGVVNELQKEVEQ